MKTKRGKILKSIFFSLAVLSVLLFLGCATSQKAVPPPSAPNPETSEAVPPAPKPEPEIAAATPAPPSPPPGEIIEITLKAAPSPETKDAREAEEPAAETREDPVEAGSILLNPSVVRDAKMIQGRLGDLGFYQGAADGVWGNGSQLALKRFKYKNSFSNLDNWNKETQIALFKKRSQSERPATAMGQDQVESGLVLLNPSAPKDAKSIQSRLAELGFYKGSIDGVWGRGSQAALKAFKEKIGLPRPDRWDKETQMLLFKETS